MTWDGMVWNGRLGKARMCERALLVRSLIVVLWVHLLGKGGREGKKEKGLEVWVEAWIGWEVT